MEIDERGWANINDEIKNFNAYSNLLKKNRCSPKLEIEEWIKTNTAMYESGRSSKTKANARAELGLWYTMWSVLAAPYRKEIPKHPFYDYAPPEYSDYVEEDILLVYKNMTHSRIDAHGSPPSDLQSSLMWHEDILRDSLKIVKRVKKKVTYVQPEASAPAMNPLQSIHSPNSIMGATSDIDRLGNHSMPGVSASLGPQDLSDMGIAPSGYYSSPPSMGTMVAEQNSLGDPVLMGGGMNSSWNYNQDGVMQNNNQFQIGHNDGGITQFNNPFQLDQSLSEAAHENQPFPLNHNSGGVSPVNDQFEMGQQYIYEQEFGASGPSRPYGWPGHDEAI